MSGTVFAIGVTDWVFLATEIVQYQPRSVIGTFWIAPTPSAYSQAGDFWVDNVLEENQAQGLLNKRERIEAEGELLARPLVIFLTGNIINPGDYTFMAGITRFWEGRLLLEALAARNISAHTEVSYPESLEDPDPITSTSYSVWEKLTLDDWEDYIRRSLVSRHGKKMFSSWLRRNFEKP